MMRSPSEPILKAASLEDKPVTAVKCSKKVFYTTVHSNYYESQVVTQFQHVIQQLQELASLLKNKSTTLLHSLSE